jgi:hypothetical protein
VLADLSSRHRSLTVALLVATAIVLVRSAVFLIWEHAGFDSDQAIFGLMAKHITEGRAFPMFIYGAQYLLAVQAWLAAPLFALFGPSVAVLKVPMVVVNLVTAGLLIWVLHRDGGLKPAVALVASAFYILAPPGIAASLVETGGGNPEPFLYVLLLWILRGPSTPSKAEPSTSLRTGYPLAFGVVLGIGFLQREFTAYGAVAIVVLAVLDSPRLTADRLRSIALAGLGYMCVWQLAQIAFLYSTPNGPGSGIAEPLGASSNVEGLLERACWDASRIGPALVGLFRDYFALPFGVNDDGLGAFGVNSFRRTGLEGVPSIWPLLRLTLLVALGRALWISVRDRAPIWRGRAAVGTFFLLVGLQSGVIYTVARCGALEAGTFRYALLSLYAGVGVLALFYIYERQRVWLVCITTVMALWAAVSIGAHVGLVREYVEQQPRNVRRELANYLVDHGIRYARSDYWTAYYTTFLADERVIVASTETVRIDEYQRLESAHHSEAVTLLRKPCPQPGGREIVSGQYWMCRE